MRPPSLLNMTAQIRAKELPDEFVVRSKNLFCKWCNKVMYSLRKDNIIQHLHSKTHQDNRMEQGAPMSFDPDSPKIQYLRNKRKMARQKRRASAKSGKSQVKSSSVSDEEETDDGRSNDDDDDEDEEEELKQIFDKSDSEDSDSFEGFDESAVFEVSKKLNRPRKRPARLNEASSSPQLTSPPAKRRKGQSSSESGMSPGSPFSIRSLPLKKQMSYSARVSNALSTAKTAKKGTLKIKISRKSKEKPKSFHVESSETESSEQPKHDEGRYNDNGLTYNGFVSKEAKPMKTQAPHKGLKMKFVIKKLDESDSEEPSLNSPNARMKTKKPRQKKASSGRGRGRPPKSHYQKSPHSVKSPPPQPPSPYAPPVDEIIPDEEEVVEEEVQPLDGEVIEEEIVEVDEGEVVSWEDVAADEEPEVLEEEEQSNVEEEITAEENLARKANHARKMAKHVNSAQFKKKRLTAQKKKQLAKQEEKKQRQTTGYNLWSSRMRKQVATQYPGLQFGDVSKKLGDLWKRIPEKEKQMWKYRSEKMVVKMQNVQTPNKRKQGSKMIETGPRKRQPKASTPRQTQLRNASLAPYPPHKNPEQIMRRELKKLPPPATDPIDAAAHFHLLGESLLNIGKKVRGSASPSSMSGVLPTLLDSLLCAMAPLMSLTNQIPQLEGAIPEATMSDTLANIAYYIPGV